MKVGIIGSNRMKFTASTEKRAKEWIRTILNAYENPVLVSGHCHQGGVDIWAEEIAKELNMEMELKVPEVLEWNPDGKYGFRQRNLDIARESDVLYIIVPEDYVASAELRFESCYHCENDSLGCKRKHIKSGACWTGIWARRLGKPVKWLIIK